MTKITIEPQQRKPIDRDCMRDYIIDFDCVNFKIMHANAPLLANLQSGFVGVQVFALHPRNLELY